MAAVVGFGWLASQGGLQAAHEPFTLRFGAAGGLNIPLGSASDDVLRLGQRGDALAAYDPNDMPLPPAPPGDAVPQLYVTAVDPALGQSWHDFRPLEGSQSWELNLVGMSPGVSVSLNWQLEDSPVGGLPLSLVDRSSGAVIVPDMTATSTLLCRDRDRVFLVVYGNPNRPPTAAPDAAFMLASDGSASLPLADLLANDYDPDLGDHLGVVAVGVPHLPGGPLPAPGAAPYGSTALDAANRVLVFAPPNPLPPDWTGMVVFDYTVQDDSALGVGQGTGLVQLHVAPDVTQGPVARHVEGAPGQVVEFVYTLHHDGALESLRLEYALPTYGAGADVGFWAFAGGYADTAADTPAPVIDDGSGPDGLVGTDDDSGMIRLDFGTQVPPSGTQLRFAVRLPTADRNGGTLQSQALYRRTGAAETECRQALAAVEVRLTHHSTHFVAGAGGRIEGDLAQTVEHGGNATEVRAVPDRGYAFVGWSLNGVPYSTENPLTLTGVTSALSLDALFKVADPAPPVGDFVAVVDTSAVAGGRGLWDVTGTYATTAGGNPLTVNLLHDASGILTGDAAYATDDATGTVLRLSGMPVRGIVRGSAAGTTLSFAVRGADPAAGLSLKLTVALAVVPATRTLNGVLSGTVSIGGNRSRLGEPQVWQLPAAMDGTWDLALLDLHVVQSRASGTALLTLANAAQHHFLANGRLGTDGASVLLSLSATPGDTGTRAVRIRTRILTLEGSAAELQSFSGTGYGQTLSW